MEFRQTQNNTVQYAAAGGVVVRGGRVLVLRRPSKGEVRLPKGHIEPGESPDETALRETEEESGYGAADIESALGSQMVEFDHKGKHYIRTEHYFLMSLPDTPEVNTPRGEDQFLPDWLPWEEALSQLTFEAEREWVRRARRVIG
ncbi:MAG: hypothetical protein AUJ92_14720 [Armatimonadetes bacterium CG2_30_59_28]|nr:NUDIX domain-containing protein [Armatimonadota bacterium]OIO92313.1 MAG: hypothetical protein AUJ92_14720 [Armatimonadetes bacterium CG2_30_59_28]PIU65284.1 MAG: DNA mismatch repair protein MutT [Armatimonadetes bacterium CG07_land_8_20_14_0_80_59_28]PIX38123.1 MAG: DNA mismatch repair protein MutT [Armatimonadetes bacterium CG_4_8_14_3_um_filter_58_9]PIY49449.1 MAG: DNA mismatch repair protein MutT [Armatimonadetes bacterium CG_4_10_14_3_um_filter_59_10]PJB64181.1 MAG: DNA mismatch repair